MNKAPTVVSLRVLLLLLMGLLFAVALFHAVRDLRQNQAAYRNASILAERNHLADACLQAVQNFAFERGRSSVVLLGQNTISDRSRDFLAANRETADSRLGEVFAHLAEVAPEPSLLASSAEVRRAWERVKALRPALERDFSLPLADRDAALPGEWRAAADELVGRLEALLVDISNFPGEIDAGLERLSTLRTLALQFRNLIGSEASLFAGELSSGRAPSSDAVGSATLLRGRSTQLWAQLDAGIARLGEQKSSAARDKLSAELFGRLRPLQDGLVGAAGGLSMPPPASLDAYLATSVAALNASAELANAINAAASSYTQARLDQARRQAMRSLASIVAVLLLAGLVVVVLVRRFTRPLNDVLGRIDALLGGPAGVAPETLPRSAGDEFGRIVEALGRLDEALAARARSEAALDESERISASILACVPQSIIATDPHGLITVFSPGAEKMLGYAASEMLGTQMVQVVHDRDELRERAQALSRELGNEVMADFNVFIALSHSGSAAQTREWTYLRKDGRRLTVLLATTTLRDSRGEVDGYLGVATDVTERTLAAAEVRRMAQHDQLTGLPNRRLFNDRMHVAISQARRDSARLALMLLDLDRFKPVNDSLGHAVGDLLLKAVASRLGACLRESDTLARIGGDEFVVILPGIGDSDDALGVAEKIRQALAEPFLLDGGHVVNISGSVGVAIFPEHGKDEAHLSKSADDAMYQAKERGRNRVQLFSVAPASGKRSEVVDHESSIIRLVWKRSYRCGEALIDQQHHELFVRANDLMQAALSDGGDGAHVTLALDGFIEALARHFASEEALLAEYQYGALDDHVEQHRSLLAGARQLRLRVDDGDVALGDLVTYLARDVVIRHLLKEDRLFFPLLKQADRGAASHEH